MPMIIDDIIMGLTAAASAISSAATSAAGALGIGTGAGAISGGTGVTAAAAPSVATAATAPTAAEAATVAVPTALKAGGGSAAEAAAGMTAGESARAASIPIEQVLAGAGKNAELGLGEGTVLTKTGSAYGGASDMFGPGLQVSQLGQGTAATPVQGAPGFLGQPGLGATASGPGLPMHAPLQSGDFQNIERGLRLARQAKGQVDQQQQQARAPGPMLSTPRGVRPLENITFPQGSPIYAALERMRQHGAGLGIVGI